MTRQDIKDIVVSVIIGILFTFLPCWEWTGNFQQILGSVIFTMLTFLVLI